MAQALIIAMFLIAMMSWSSVPAQDSDPLGYLGPG